MTKSEKSNLKRVISLLEFLSSSYSSISDRERRNASCHFDDGAPHEGSFCLGCAFTLDYAHSDLERILAMLQNIAGEVLDHA